LDLQEYREQSHAIWGAMAAGWHRERGYMWEVTHPVGDWMVGKLDPKPGQTILELAAGVGDTGFAAATRMGNGRVISTDFSAEMVEAARERGQELGLDNVEHRVMDAEKMDLATDSVDGVLCRWGYMLMADPEAALGETRRVLREGGRLCFSVWAGPERNPWAAIPGATLVERGHLPPPEPGAPGIFSMSDPERIRDLLGGAGFGPPTVEEMQIAFPFEDFEGYWRYITELAGGMAVAIRKLDDDEKRSVRGLIEERIGALRSDGGYSMPGLCLNVAAS
jgi:SAM-dependent methyltransferase